MARVVLEQADNGHIVVTSEGAPGDLTERMLLAALAGVQRELLAQRTASLVLAQRDRSVGRLVMPR